MLAVGGSLSAVILSVAVSLASWLPPAPVLPRSSIARVSVVLALGASTAWYAIVAPRLPAIDKAKTLKSIDNWVRKEKPVKSPPRNQNEFDLNKARFKPGFFYIALWKKSRDPKVEILFSRPNPDQWEFIECKVNRELR